MKALKNISTLFLLLIIFLNGYSQSDTINYFDQLPPGKTPVKFAQDFISKPDRSEVNPMYTPDGMEFYFTIMNDQNWSFIKTMVSKYANEEWSIPVDAGISVKTFDWGAVFSPDNETMYFSSAESNWDYDIYKRERTDSGWSEATLLPGVINRTGSSLITSISIDETLYFRSSLQGNNDIYYSNKTTNGYDTLIRMDYPINSPQNESHPTIAPNKDFLIFYRGIDSPSSAIYISFAKANNKWTNPKKMGLPIHTGQPGFSSISPDNKYLLYQGVDKDLYWVDLVNLVDSLKNSNYSPYLINPVKDTTAIVGIEFRYDLPDSLFIDDDGNETLIFDASLSNDEPLPSWLEFNAMSKSFSGIPLTSESINIKVSATDNSGGSVSDYFVLSINQPTDIKSELTDKEFIIYPNPAKGSSIYVQNKNNDSPINYQLFDMTGIVVKQGCVEFSRINILDLPNGIYMLNLKLINRTIITKILIE